MQELLPGALGGVLNHALGDPIMEMSIHITEGKLLVALLACLLKCIVHKLLIVAVIVLYCHAMSLHLLFPLTTGFA